MATSSPCPSFHFFIQYAIQNIIYLPSQSDAHTNWKRVNADDGKLRNTAQLDVKYSVTQDVKKLLVYKLN